MIVYDDKAVLHATLGMLDALGYLAVPAPSGAVALRLITGGLDFDLVLADFVMPAMTGVELANAIRITHPSLPVILVTGYGNCEMLSDFGEARILQKSYGENELMEKIANALS